MADEKTEKVTPLNDETLENVAGGWAGSDNKYTEGEYMQAGIILNRDIFGLVRYFYKGTAITQEEADKITDEWFELNGHPIFP